MEELIQKLQSIHGLTAEQSHSILGTIAGYIKEKFPMVAGAIDNIIPTGNATTANTQATSTATTQDSGDLLDKISDFIPGATGEKIEEFAKDKLGGFFGGNKAV
ncbi:hypothetical protein FW778_05975 [Ginsengibacter hankyongi]|uniref:DUF2267 domain-containing protein n=1 Tax=Ginsengibacter hankyongi TaxID=2607284 RepID=A0A5J5IM13_9BACT|nr:hypothetical protein [Ginsengibacter hankyongi]KAA9041568.1 hypothetical protein FW778_05975 [Ginsengibacter hankyongi]